MSRLTSDQRRSKNSIVVCTAVQARLTLTALLPLSAAFPVATPAGGGSAPMAVMMAGGGSALPYAVMSNAS